VGARCFLLVFGVVMLAQKQKKREKKKKTNVVPGLKRHGFVVVLKGD
jgi:hypothetical protein